MSWRELWQRARDGLVSAVWVDGHCFHVDASGRALLDGEQACELQYPALGAAVRLLRLLWLPAGAQNRSIDALCQSILGAEEPIATPIEPTTRGELPQIEGATYYLLANSVASAQPWAVNTRRSELLDVLCGKPEEVIDRCCAYLAMHEERIALSQHARAEIMRSARHLTEAGLVAFALAFVVCNGLDVSHLAAEPFCLAALVAVRPSR